MKQEFKEDTVNIILNEMFTEGRKTLSQSEFDKITKKYAKRIVKLFAIPNVSCCAFIDNIAPMTECIEGKHYKHEYKKLIIPVIEYNELKKAAKDFDNEHYN